MKCSSIYSIIRMNILDPLIVGINILDPLCCRYQYFLSTLFMISIFWILRDVVIVNHKADATLACHNHKVLALLCCLCVALP